MSRLDYFTLSVEEAMCISIEEWRERLSKYFELYGLRAFLCYSKDDIVKSDILRAPLLKRYEKSYGSTEAVMAACNFYFKSAIVLSPISFTSKYGSSRLFSTMEIIRLIGFASSVCVRVAAQNNSKEFSYGNDAPDVQMKEDLGIVSCNDETKNFMNNYEHVDGDARCSYERKDHIGSLQSHGEKKGQNGGSILARENEEQLVDLSMDICAQSLENAGTGGIIVSQDVFFKQSNGQEDSSRETDLSDTPQQHALVKQEQAENVDVLMSTKKSSYGGATPLEVNEGGGSDIPTPMMSLNMVKCEDDDEVAVLTNDGNDVPLVSDASIVADSPTLGYSFEYGDLSDGGQKRMFGRSAVDGSTSASTHMERSDDFMKTGRMAYDITWSCDEI